MGLGYRLAHIGERRLRIASYEVMKDGDLQNAVI